MKKSKMFDRHVRTRARTVPCRIMLALASCVMGFTASRTIAQPGDPTPANYVDLGDIAIGQVKDSGEVDLASGKYVWFRINVLNDISVSSSWLDIDTLGPNVIQNNMMAIYDNQKNLVAIDNDSGGSGTAGTNFAAAMSFGAGSGQRLSLSPAGGVLSNGFNGQLSAGVYWVCLGAYFTTFPDPNNNWDTTTSSTTAGKVRVKVTAGAKSKDFWNEAHHGGDGGGSTGTAQVVEGRGPLKTIMTAFGGFNSRDMFKVHICDPALFKVIAESSVTSDGGGGSYGSRLYLFGVDGKGIIAINRGANDLTTLVARSDTPLLPGDYYLAVSSACGGENGLFGSPYSKTGAVWDFGLAPSNTVIRPNGPGAADPLLIWGRQANCNSVDAYVVKLSLSGVCFVESNCPSDFNGDGFVNGGDFDAFVDAFTAGC